MYKYCITYNDFEGVPQTRNLYFNLTTAEVLDLEFVKGYKMTQKIQDVVEATKSNDVAIREKGNKAAYILFKDLMEAAYGEKDASGNFVKRDEYGNPYYLKFETTEAYSEFFMTLLTNGDIAGKFLSEVIPTANMQKFADKVNNTNYNTTNINNQINNQMNNQALPYMQ